MNDTTSAGSYHELMEAQFSDRLGFPPRFENESDRLELEHDWVLLLFARSEKLQAAAKCAVEIIQKKNDLEDYNYGTHHLLQIAQTLACGKCDDIPARGYLTFQTALLVLASKG